MSALRIAITHRDLDMRPTQNKTSLHFLLNPEPANTNEVRGYQGDSPVGQFREVQSLEIPPSPPASTTSNNGEVLLPEKVRKISAAHEEICSTFDSCAGEKRSIGLQEALKNPLLRSSGMREQIQSRSFDELCAWAQKMTVANARSLATLCFELAQHEGCRVAREQCVELILISGHAPELQTVATVIANFPEKLRGPVPPQYVLSKWEKLRWAPDGSAVQLMKQAVAERLRGQRMSIDSLVNQRDERPQPNPLRRPSEIQPQSGAHVPSSGDRPVESFQVLRHAILTSQELARLSTNASVALENLLAGLGMAGGILQPFAKNTYDEICRNFVKKNMTTPQADSLCGLYKTLEPQGYVLACEQIVSLMLIGCGAPSRQHLPIITGNLSRKLHGPFNKSRIVARWETRKRVQEGSPLKTVQQAVIQAFRATEAPPENPDLSNDSTRKRKRD